MFGTGLDCLHRGGTDGHDWLGDHDHNSDCSCDCLHWPCCPAPCWKTDESVDQEYLATCKGVWYLLTGNQLDKLNSYCTY